MLLLGDCHRLHEMRPETILKKLTQLDAFRNPERFEKFLLCCEADAHGRPGFENKPYPQADLFRDCLKAAKNASIDTVLQQNLPPEKLAEAIAAVRAEAIKVFIATK